MGKVAPISRDSRDRKLTSQYQYKEAKKKRLGGRRGVSLALAAAVLVLIPMSGSAQLNSKVANVSLNASLSTAITVTAAPGVVNFALLRSGISTGSAPISITTTWTLPFFIGTVKEYAYFTSAASALADGAGDNIASANVSGSVNGGAFTAFTGASPFAAGSSLAIFNQFIFFFNINATRTDSLNLSINTTGLNLPAGAYTGVLHIQAQGL
jgi:hypothetical protein